MRTFETESHVCLGTTFIPVYGWKGRAKNFLLFHLHVDHWEPR